MAFSTDPSGVAITPLTVVASICVTFVVFIGIFSWLSKRLSVAWWRGVCGCEEGETHSFSNVNNNNKEIMNTVTTQPIRPPTIYVDEFDDIRKNTKNPGRENRAFEQERNKTNQAVPRHQGTMPADIKVHVDSSQIDSNRLQPQKSWNSVLASDFQDSFRSRTTSNTGDYRLVAKVISRPSITSGYDSDTESYDLPTRHTARKTTGGRYSGRNVEKRRHRRKPHSRMGNKKGPERMRKYATSSLVNQTPHHPRAPITRRHSYAVAAHGIFRQQSAVTKPAPPPRTKKKRSASDAHLFLGNKPTTTTFDNSKPASFRTDKPLRSENATCSSTKDETQQSHVEKQLTPDGLQHPKASTLVRSGTIMEVPIYARKERLRSSKRITSHGQAGFTKKTRQKPPRSHINKEKRHSKTEKWQYGYGSLPADLGKIQSGMLEQMGLTAESFVESIEKLDFDTLCRPVPHITDNQRLTSPRKPVIDKHMPGHEQELLKDTYRLEEFGIVATDL